MTETTNKDKKRPGLIMAALPLVVMALLLGVGYGVYRIKAQILLVTAALVTGLLGRWLGYSWEEMQQGIVESIRKSLPAIMIMLCVGMLIAAWIACGTIPVFLYYGLKLVSAKYFLVTACVVCSIASLVTGTSWGTVGTLGVAFIGIAIALKVPLGPAAGAIVAGAYFGDKFSPFSDIPNLAPIAAGSNLFDNIRHMFWSAIPAWLAGLVIYFFMGLGYGDSGVTSPMVGRIMETLRAHFSFNILLLLPMVVIFYFALAKKPVIPGMLLSIVIAGILAVWLQKIPVVDLAQYLNSGYVAQTGVAEVDRLISRGGIMSMMETLLIAFAAFSFGGIMQRTGLLVVLLERVMRFAQRVWSLVLTTVVSALFTAMITGSSYLSMLIPGELLAPVFRQKNLAAKNLSRIIEESGAIMVPLVPWSMAGVYITGIIGVPVLSYLPFAFMNYLSVVMLIIFGFTGFTMAPRVRDDETQIGS